jgi:hypothetical protein
MYPAAAAAAAASALTWREELEAEECLAILDVCVDLVNNLHLETSCSCAQTRGARCQFSLGVLLLQVYCWLVTDKSVPDLIQRTCGFVSGFLWWRVLWQQLDQQQAAKDCAANVEIAENER